MPNPDFTRIWGQNATNTAITDISYNGGWASEAGANPPSIPQANAIEEEQDIKLAYLDKLTRQVWDITFDYLAGETALGADAELYIALINNIGFEPSVSATQWIKAGYVRGLSGYGESGRHDLYTGNLNDIAINSTYNFSNVSATGQPAGIEDWGFVTTYVYVNNSSYITQLCLSMNSGDGETYIRHKVSGVWNLWIRTDVAVIKASTEAVAGIAKVATQELTDAGVNDTDFVPPKKLRWGFAISLGVNGYIIYPSWLGGKIKQWGRVVNTPIDATFRPVNFPIPFPTALHSIHTQWLRSAAIGGTLEVLIKKDTVSLTKFDYMLDYDTNAYGADSDIFWTAEGY